MSLTNEDKEILKVILKHEIEEVKEDEKKIVHPRIKFLGGEEKYKEKLKEILDKL